MARNYDPKRVVCIVGTVVVQGFADGDFIAVEKRNDDWELTVGADGEGTRTRLNDESGSVTITLAASSSSNALLLAQAQIDRVSGFAQVPIFIKDLMGNDLVKAEQAWLRKMPAMTYGKSLGQREWVFDTDNITMAPAGSSF